MNTRNKSTKTRRKSAAGSKSAARGKRAKSRSKAKSRRRSRGCLWWALGLIGLCVAVFALVFFSNTEKGYRGIDVSHHQGNIDWHTVGEATDLDFVFIKATEGLSHRDKTFEYNLHGARMAAIKAGAYHFFLPGASGREQFSHFSYVVGRDIDLRPVLDLELPPRTTIADPEAYRREVTAYIQACKAYYGCLPIVYASPSFVKDMQLQPVITDCPYWIAWYPRFPIFTASGRRFLHSAYPGVNAVAWQYTDRGHHAGITGNVDINECWDFDTLLLPK